MLSVELNTNLEERSLANDLKMGGESEDANEAIFNRVFGDTFVNTKIKYNDPYCPYDYEGETTNTRIELKSRRNTYRAYPTTIVPVSKVLSTHKGRHIFTFLFTDGLYYVDYDSDKFSKYEIKMITTQRKGIVDKPKPHFCIPIVDLQKIN